MRTVKTKQGDTWDIIALRELGSELLMHELINANMRYSAVAFFEANITLNIPDLDYQAYADVNLPPWR